MKTLWQFFYKKNPGSRASPILYQGYNLMPHLTLQISPGGPLIDLLVGVSKPRADALKASSLPVPQAIQIRALIDTGASCTCIDSQILNQLKLSPTGTISIHTPSTLGDPHFCNQ